LDPQLEDLINSHLEHAERGTMLTLPPVVQSRIVEAIRRQVQQVNASTGGRLPAVLCSPQVRLWVRRMIEPLLPQVAVLGYNEIVRGLEVETKGMVTLTHEAPNVPS